MTDFVELTRRPWMVAQVISGALESEGLSVRLERETFASVYGLDVGRWATRILVAPGDLAAARALLAEVEDAEPA